MKTRKIYRHAETGKIVSKEYAEKHSKTTVSDTVPVKPRKKKRA
jgi:hypothetical protein